MKGKNCYHAQARCLRTITAMMRFHDLSDDCALPRNSYDAVIESGLLDQVGERLREILSGARPTARIPRL